VSSSATAAPPITATIDPRTVNINAANGAYITLLPQHDAERLADEEPFGPAAFSIHPHSQQQQQFQKLTTRSPPFVMPATHSASSLLSYTQQQQSVPPIATSAPPTAATVVAPVISNLSSQSPLKPQKANSTRAASSKPLQIPLAVRGRRSFVRLYI
jgi:hypothetical protein